MSEPNGAGTQTTPPDDADKSGGTQAGVADGSETAGLTEDQKNLLAAWKQKAEKGNEALERLREAEARLAAAERAQYGQAQPVNPVMAAIAQDAQLEAMGDAEAAARMALWRTTMQQAQETRLNDELDELGVSGPERKRIKDAVRKSGFQIGVQEARLATRGAEAESLAEANRKLVERNRALEAALSGQAAKPSGNPATTGPSAPGVEREAVTLEEWRALPRDQRDKVAIRPN